MVCCGRSMVLLAVCANPYHVVTGAGQSKCCSVYGPDRQYTHEWFKSYDEVPRPAVTLFVQLINFNRVSISGFKCTEI